MNIVQEELPVVYLKPGETYFSSTPSLVSTVLGSCVSVTMYCARLKTGAICHGMLPDCDRWDMCSRNSEDCFRFVDCAIRNMMLRFKRAGAEKSELAVKLFGGAHITGSGDIPDSINVGMKNVAQAHAVIESERLRLVASDTGGFMGRKMFFYTHTGLVLMKRIGDRTLTGRVSSDGAIAQER